MQHDEHMRDKDMARQQKSSDKLRAEQDPSIVVCTFDMQAVPNTPHAEASILYYKRKHRPIKKTRNTMTDRTKKVQDMVQRFMAPLPI